VSIGGEAYPIIKRLQKHFGEGLLLVFRNFPLSQMHTHAESAAETAEFAGSHDKFWEMHDLLFENQDRLEDSLLVKLTEELHLEPAKLQDVLTNKVFQSRVRADFAGGARSGVNGTPTFFITGQRHDGSFDFDSLAGAIEVPTVAQ
jgi:protein-disulfide isomerase